MWQLFDAIVGFIPNYLCEFLGFGISKVLKRVHFKFHFLKLFKKKNPLPPPVVVLVSLADIHSL